jgi:outer membrane biosynthesis protein TonB
MRNRTLMLSGLIVFLALLLLSCTIGSGSVSNVTATPTKTARPLFTSTHTPTATPLLTDTAVPPTEPPPTAVPSDTAAVPTEVPPTEPPPASATPLPPTEVPPTEVPPTDTAIPPTNTPQPKPTNTPAPPTNTPKPQVDFRVVEQRLMTKAENEAQRHMILVRVVDAGNSPLSGVTVWDPSHPEQEAVSGSKPEPYHAEYLFWDYSAYRLEVKGATSEQTKILTTEVHLISKEDLVGAGYCPDVANCNQDELAQHFSWFVTFQRTW